MSTTLIPHPYVRGHNWFERLVLKKSFWLLFTAILFAYPVYRSMNRTLPPELPVLGRVPTFRLVNENGKNFGSGDLIGRTYLANFMFTSCPTSCPELMKHMQVVQKRVKGVGDKIALVSFTVDPETDTPEKLLKHARAYSANPYIWTFLTGTQTQVERLLIDGFKVPVGKKDPMEGVNVYDIAHSNRIVLVDHKGQIRGYYSTDKTSTDQLMIDLGLLINREMKKVN